MNYYAENPKITLRVSIGDAMLIGVGMSENGDNGKKSAISSVSEDATVPDGENGETDR